MKILMVSSYLPYPLLSGGQVRLYNLIRELSPIHEITLICEKRPHQTIEDIKEMEKICKKVLTVERRKQWSIDNIVKAGFSNNSFLLTGHTHPQMQQLIEQELASTSYDVIHIETFYVMQNLPTVSIPVVLAEHNIEYLVYERFIQRAPVLLRPLLRMDVSKMKREEETYWHQATKLVAVSKEELKKMESRGVQAKLVSNGVNTDQFTYKNIDHAITQKEKKILFIGDFKWIQNRDTALWIIKEIWPKIKSELGTRNQESGLKLWVVGRTIPDSIKSLTNDPDVLFDEKSSAKATQEIFQEAYILLSPIRVGGGTSYKILESMSCGTPVVTMQLSANALGAKDGQNVMVGQTPEELTAKTIELLEDHRLYKEISKNGRVLIENNYTWKAIAKVLESVYKEVIKK